MQLPLWNIVWPFIRKLNMPLSYKPARALTGIYPREMKIYIYIKTCIQMFVATLFVIAPNGNNPGSSTNVVLPDHETLFSNTKELLLIM